MGEKTTLSRKVAGLSGRGLGWHRGCLMVANPSGGGGGEGEGPREVGKDKFASKHGSVIGDI